MQLYKGDETELKFVAGGADVFDTVSTVKDLFYEECFECFILGEILFDSARSPLANAIDRTIFRSSFTEIYDAFVDVGTFEAYLTVFSKIFGSTSTVTFTVPAAGKLNIDITALGIEESIFQDRYIENNAYQYAEVTTQAGEHIIFQSIKGFQSEYELEKMLFEMVPAGIFTTITLNL